MIDTSSSGLPPRDVRLAAQALRDAASRWVHVSTASVCSGWPHRTPAESSEVLDCPSDADESFGHSGVQRGHRSCVRTKLVLGGESAEVFQALGGSLATRRSLTAAP
ncbi:NAD-dependent epimerase/dehydratase [Streptomyces zinciresistens K42]|uniref:NAD-dependent epimerase/dehydratase n=1 Tax=Streptomyces zinciresistens K42 TaxID=700597 RepID=G2GM50_9ACTN|nr:NAD-dependent epimerase/dehydratase [Streptomyces zinciresistens K42]